MAAALQLQDLREQTYSRLIAASLPPAREEIVRIPPTAAQEADTDSSPNREWLACMLASWCAGQGALPGHLGLEPGQFHALTEHFFPGCKLPESAPSGSRLDFSRMLEKDDLIKLLKTFSKPGLVEIDWIIGIIVAGSLGSDHLWQDLGLWSRSQLSALLQYNFPELAAKNDKDMKWKKFIYKQLCEAEGLYLCRVPSCEVCLDYSKCYGSEE